MICAIDATYFEAFEPEIDWHLNSFCDRSGGSITRESLRADIMAHHYQVWAVRIAGTIKAVALTFIKEDATKTCVISHCAGNDFEQWSGALIATIRVWSASLGSTKLEAVTRPGWERVLRKFGMKKTHVVLELENVKGEDDQHQPSATVDPQRV